MVGEIPERDEENLVSGAPVPEGGPDLGQSTPTPEATGPDSLDSLEGAATQGEVKVPETEAEKFDYEAERKKIDERYTERTRKLSALIQEMFTDRDDYYKEKNWARDKVNVAKSKNKEPNLSAEEQLALRIEEKADEINRDQKEGIRQLEEKKRKFEEAQKRRIIEGRLGEI